MDALWSLGLIESFWTCDPLGICDIESTYVVASGEGRSVKFKDGVAATAACGKEPTFRGGAVATRKGNNPANTRISQTSRIDIALRLSCERNC